jgi:hypothetical protein
VSDENGLLRFKANPIVRLLLDKGPLTLNALADLAFSNEDRQQFAQLIGYSVGGYQDLPYVDNDVEVPKPEAEQSGCQGAGLVQKRIELQGALQLAEQEGGFCENDVIVGGQSVAVAIGKACGFEGAEKGRAPYHEGDGVLAKVTIELVLNQDRLDGP